jgi:hypothetical protein
VLDHLSAQDAALAKIIEALLAAQAQIGARGAAPAP